MPDFEKMYYELAAKVADAIDLLITAQQRGEDEYVEDIEEPTDEVENRD
ncbi:MAG: hypothetical protein LBN02_03200 [Oscillospiraceae bacterium]|jgi:hypothetical protein|nr:hypothetical protein [Oscillospiraceae bacterium]